MQHLHLNVRILPFRNLQYAKGIEQPGARTANCVVRSYWPGSCRSL